MLVFLGSARKDGNTAALCREAIKGAAEKGMKARLVKLSELEILACRGCFKCKDGACSSHRDDMNTLLAQMQQADAFIFATPVYFWNVSGLMKMFFDRLLPLLIIKKDKDRTRLVSRIKGKRAAIIVVQEEAKGPHASIPMMFFERNFADFGLELEGSVFIYGALHAGDVNKDEAGLEEARMLGRMLAK